MKKIVIMIVVLAITAAVFFIRIVFSDDAREFYYVRIDNSAIENLGPRKGVIDFNGGMEYGYKLIGYNEWGAEKNVSFGTNRQLREGAYLKLSVVPIRGVTEWEEVIFEEMPEAVREKMKQDLPKAG